ncbi:MAG: cytochrome c peroxidase [Planctomycetota bacterium]|nr:cytochrome c peroxidase [Planctomycetota bacterium]
MLKNSLWLLLIATLDPVQVFSQADFEFKIPKGLKSMKIPRDNPMTADKVHLGKQLYFDKRLSIDNTVSCASCHDPAKGWSNGTAFATGVKGQQGGRSAPTIINSGYQFFQFWDGRAHQLEGQALGPIQNPIEMGLSLKEMEVKLSQIKGYVKQFKLVFGNPPNAEDTAKAIAAFERTVLSGNAPYDQFKDGNQSALSEAAKRGQNIFFNKAQCSACHAGPNFTDGGFHNIGTAMNKKEKDLGRFSVTKLEGDTGSFKTPTLREIQRTAPYMHDGSLTSLEQVVDFYNKGGIANPQLDEEIFPLNLTDENKKDLVIFLKEGLSSKDYPEIKPPKLPE